MNKGRRGRDRILIRYTTTYAFSADHWFQILIMARCTTLCDKGCQWLATGWWFSPGSLVSSTNKTDRHDIAEILLKVVLNIIKQTNKPNYLNSPHDVHRSSSQYHDNCVRTSKLFSYYLEIYQNKFWNLICTIKFFSFSLEIYQNKFWNLICISIFKCLFRRLFEQPFCYKVYIANELSITPKCAGIC